MPAEAEAVGEDASDADFAGCVRDVVEVAAGFASWLSRLIVGCRTPCLMRQGAGDQLDAAGGAEQVADHALGAGDRQLAGRGRRRPS